MIHLVDIDDGNWRIPLKVSKEQELYVANSTTMLAKNSMQVMDLWK